MNTLTAVIGMLVHIIIVDIFGNIREQLFADLVCRLVEDDNLDSHFVFKKKVANNINSNL